MSEGGLLDSSPLFLDSSELHCLCLTIHLLQIHLYMYYTCYSLQKSILFVLKHKGRDEYKMNI